MNMDGLEVRLSLIEQTVQNLEKRMEKVENKMEILHTDMLRSNNLLIRTVIASAGTIVGGILSVLVVMLM